MNLRRLKYFVKIVDIGSLTQAAQVLFIAQPALSQQLATLEARSASSCWCAPARRHAHRGRQGAVPACADHPAPVRPGHERHGAAGQGLSGQVSVGMAPGTAATTLALPLLRTVRARHPGILLYLNENYGTTLSELIMNGRMDLAVLYGDKAIHGLSSCRC
jgi:LysR family nitrogen assimilation transcriptional regulator